jgi:hypothetical protein
MEATTAEEEVFSTSRPAVNCSRTVRWRVCDQMTFMRSASPSIALPAQPARLPTGEGGVPDLGTRMEATTAEEEVFSTSRPAVNCSRTVAELASV